MAAITINDEKLCDEIRRYCQQKSVPVMEFVEGTLEVAMMFSEGIDVPDSFRKDEVRKYMRLAKMYKKRSERIANEQTLRNVIMLKNEAIRCLAVMLGVRYDLLREYLSDAIKNAVLWTELLENPNTIVILDRRKIGMGKNGK